MPLPSRPSPRSPSRPIPAPPPAGPQGTWLSFPWLLPLLLASAASAPAELRPQLIATDGKAAVEIHDHATPVFLPLADQAGLRVVLPGETAAVHYAHGGDENGLLHLEGGRCHGLTFAETWRRLAPELLERTVTVTAAADQRYYLDFGWRTAGDGAYCSFLGGEPETVRYSPSCAGPEFDLQGRQTFPFLGVRVGDRLCGILADSPGMWENRCFMEFNAGEKRLSLCNGDGSARRTIAIPSHLDATSVYRAPFDGWQHIEQGETQAWKTWVFSSAVRTHYDVQLAAHLALANAKGFNQSAVEAILRNTSYLLLRRNLLRPESDYLFISGIGYGWKQWVTDGFYMSRGLDDPRLDREAHAAMFFERINYEDNAQCYLIWAALVKRSGGEPDMRTVQRAWRFIREHEQDGLYRPPRLKPESKAFRTYHDQLPYEDGDAPSSNQGYHCGALLAARELGLEVTDQEIAGAVAGYRRLFNEPGGYMATSLMQPEHVGQDALYGETLTFAVFGEKLLTDEMVQRHLQTTMKIQSPHGMRVISKANGDLLDGHSGVYTWGGSWFLNDAANYLDGLIHGMDSAWVDEQLVWRLKKELAFMPAFHESISTVDGRPHGHHLYSWNSGYWWLRREVRRRLGMGGADPVDARMDAELGVVSREGRLTLQPPERPFYSATHHEP